MKNRKKKQKTKTEIVGLSPSIPVIILNISDINTIIKRQRLTTWIKIHDPTVHCLQNFLSNIMV